MYIIIIIDTRLSEMDRFVHFYNVIAITRKYDHTDVYVKLVSQLCLIFKIWIVS